MSASDEVATPPYTAACHRGRRPGRGASLRDWHRNSGPRRWVARRPPFGCRLPRRPYNVNLGLLVLRVFLAAILSGHATQKLFGWFRGAGPAGTGTMFERWGFRPGTAMAVLAGVCELVGAGSIGFGLITPAGCAIIIGTMIVAAVPNSVKGLWAHLGGCEVPVVYAGLGVVIALTGPGRFSLDNALGLDQLHKLGWGIAAIVVGVVSCLPPLFRRRATLRSHPVAAP